MPMPLVARLPGCGLCYRCSPGFHPSHRQVLYTGPSLSQRPATKSAASGLSSPPPQHLVSTGPPFVQREPPPRPVWSRRSRRGVEMTAGFLCPGKSVPSGCCLPKAVSARGMWRVFAFRTAPFQRPPPDSARGAETFEAQVCPTWGYASQGGLVLTRPTLFYRLPAVCPGGFKSFGNFPSRAVSALPEPGIAPVQFAL